MFPKCIWPENHFFPLKLINIPQRTLWKHTVNKWLFFPRAFGGMKKIRLNSHVKM